MGFELLGELVRMWQETVVTYINV